MIKDSIFWLKNKLFRRASCNAYEEAMRFDSLSGVEKQKIEFEKCKALIAYAYEHVPYYKDYYSSVGFSPSQLNCWDDWNRVPPLEKTVIRNNGMSLLSDEFHIEDLSISTTGGSTGTPLKVFKDSSVPVEVMAWRSFQWWNISPSANVGILHRRTPTSFISKLKNRMIWFPTRRAYLNASKITEQDVLQFVKDIKQQHTVWLQGYCSALEVVADYIIDKRISIDNVKMIWSTSSPLSNIVRRKLEQAFSCQVMDQYGCMEMWNIAMQKPNEQCLTICSDYVHVDIVDDNNRRVDNKVTGDILMTDLNTYAYPLIKYRLGDKSSILEGAEESSDGYPKMDFVKGRISDSVCLPDGTRIDGAYLTTICDNYSDLISSFQIYQKKDYSVCLKIVLHDNVSPINSRIEDIASKLKSQIGETVQFTTEFVDSIQGDRGKKRYIISEIALAQYNKSNR